MVWENGCTVIVMMAALVEDGEKQCERYWPDEGSSLYNIYEVRIIQWSCAESPLWLLLFTTCFFSYVSGESGVRTHLV